MPRVCAFLASSDQAAGRSPSDPPHGETIDGLGNRKNELVLELIASRACEFHEGSVPYLRAALGVGCVRRHCPPAPTP